jgi:hypothetical membrane protein
MTRETTRRQLACGALAGPLFVTTFLIEGATRAHYNPLRHPVSSLAIGAFGWIQSVNFLVIGLLLLIFAFGLRRTIRIPGSTTWGPLLIGLSATCLVGAGLFTADPVSGYPSGTPNRPLTYSTHGILHALFTIVGFYALSAASLVFARYFMKRHERGWAIYSLSSGLGTLIAFFAAAKGIQEAEGFVELGGLFQRIAIVMGLGWVTLHAVKLLRASANRPPMMGADPRGLR